MKTRKEMLMEAGILRYGSEKDWRQAMREHGAKADRSTPRGFAVIDKEIVKEISRKGTEARWGNHQKATKDARTENS